MTPEQLEKLPTPRLLAFYKAQRKRFTIAEANGVPEFFSYAQTAEHYEYLARLEDEPSQAKTLLNSRENVE